MRRGKGGVVYTALCSKRGGFGMQWVFDQLVEWILENLTSCFSVLSSLLFTFFNLDRSTFDTFFSFFGSASLDGNQTSLYQLFTYFGYAVCMTIVILRLLKNFFAVVDDTDYEDPIKLVIRSIGTFILVAISGHIVNYEFKFVGKPYELVNSIMNSELESYGGMTGGVWDKLSDSLKEGLETSGGNTVVIGLITIGCLFAIFFGFVKLALEVAERYVVVCVSIYLSPLAFATAASKGTVKIMSTYIRMVFCQLLLMIFNIIFVDGTLIAIYHYADCGGSITLNGTETKCPAFIFCILLLAFITAGQKMDSYMRGLGLDVVQTGSLFDEIRGSMLNGMMMVRATGGAVRSAGGLRKAVAGGFSRIGGHASAGSGNTHSGSSGIKNTVANATRNVAASVTQTVAQNHSSLQSVAQKAAQSQIRSGAFNGFMGETAKSIVKATETAIGSEVFSKLGINPSTLSGKNGMIEFKAHNGAKGMFSFEQKNGNGWKELTNEYGDGLKAWVKGTSNLGISAAQVGTHQNLAKAIGVEGGMKLEQAIRDKDVDLPSLKAISLGNGEFSVIGQNAEGVSKRLGRIVPAEIGETISGAPILENEFGGKVGFLPEIDMLSAMNGRHLNDDGLIQIGDNMAVPADSVQEALAPMMEAENIAAGTALLGFTSDGDTFLASYADPVTGTKEIQGTVTDVLSGIDQENIHKIDPSCQWIGMNDLFDMQAYSALTGETPKKIEFGSMSDEKTGDGSNNFVITNESGNKCILDQASVTGKYNKVVRGGAMFENVPFSIQKIPEQKSSKLVLKGDLNGKRP